MERDRSLNKQKLLQFFDNRRQRKESLVLATVVETQGSTYSKTGDQMLIDESGVGCGILSGGCLEGDLAVRAQVVLESGRSQVVTYDLASEDDDIWGMGIGCDGSMQVYLQALVPRTDYQPFAEIADVLRGNIEANVTIGGIDDELSIAIRIQPPLNLLVLGAGLDSVPVTKFADELGWRCTIFDHRPAYVDNANFPASSVTHCAEASLLAATVELDHFDCAIVMSHHLVSDRTYLSQLAECSIPYIGLLGPSARRERLLSEIGDAADKLRDRMHAPAGLELGGRGPEPIALSIVAQMQQAFTRG